jgi:phage terminase large subunit GpA-like protein
VSTDFEIREHWLYQAAMEAIRPPPVLDCLAWNEKYGRLSARDSSRPGKWTSAQTPYVRHWLDLASARKIGRSFMGDRDPYAHLTEQMWIVKGTQTGLTRSVLLAILGWSVDQQPGPTGYFLPRKDDLLDVQKERILPFFEESPQLAKHLPPKGTDLRKQGLTADRWHLDTETIYWLCSSLALDLRSRPLCDEAWDEYDMAPLNAEGQGYAIDLGLDRQKTFARRRLAYGVTTPTDVTNPGWRQLLGGSHERILVDCLECGATQELNWDGLVIVDQGTCYTLKEAVAAGYDHQAVMVSGSTASLAFWSCEHCGRCHTAAERDRIVTEACRKGRWVPGQWVQNEKNPQGLWTPWADFDSGHRLTASSRCETTVRTGHMHSLYSTFVSLAEAASREMKLIKQGSDEEWIAHRNNWRAEPTLPMASQNAVTPESILEVLEHKHPRFTGPPQVQKVLITCDQQGNERDRVWFPYVCRGWGPYGESWLIDAGQVAGWDELELLEKKLWTIGTKQMPCHAIVVDAANGNVRVDVQQWAQGKANKRILLHGRANLSQPVMQRFARDPRKQTQGKRLLPNVRYYYTQSDSWKTRLNDRVTKSLGIAGWHLCADVPDAYLASLGSEHLVTVKKRDGRPGKRWVPRTIVTPSGREEEREDTHWWDCEHMQLCAAHILKYDSLLEPEPDAPAPIQQGGGFMDGYNL